MSDFTGKYNTKLSPGEEAAFTSWAKQQSVKQGRNLMRDLYDYDLRGFWKNGEGFAGNGHGADTYKKPNHPTFSDQSQYHNVDGHVGGKWSGDDSAMSFTPSPTNLKFYPPAALQDYFKRVEPNVKLAIPATSTSGALGIPYNPNGDQ